MLNIKTVFILINVLFMSFTLPAHATSKHANHSLMGSHGMVLFNDDQGNIYASHLPLYRSPHDYQIIYQVNTLQKGRLNKMIDNGMVTVLPDNFDLAILTNKKTLTINSKFFEGHFEREGKLIYKAQLTFEHPMLVEKVTIDKSATSEEYYQVKTSNHKALVVHKINNKPSFDAIGFIEISPNTDNSFSCKQADKLTVADIQQQLTSCGVTDISYIETQDFK